MKFNWNCLLDGHQAHNTDVNKAGDSHIDRPISQMLNEHTIQIKTIVLFLKEIKQSDKAINSLIIAAGWLWCANLWPD